MFLWWGTLTVERPQTCGVFLTVVYPTTETPPSEISGVSPRRKLQCLIDYYFIVILIIGFVMLLIIIIIIVIIIVVIIIARRDARERAFIQDIHAHAGRYTHTGQMSTQHSKYVCIDRIYTLACFLSVCSPFLDTRT